MAVARTVLERGDGDGGPNTSVQLALESLVIKKVTRDAGSAMASTHKAVKIWASDIDRCPLRPRVSLLVGLSFLVSCHCLKHWRSLLVQWLPALSQGAKEQRKGWGQPTAEEGKGD